MTYSFFNPNKGIYIIFDTASGAVIQADELEAYICDALDPCGEAAPRLPEKCPSEIRYELARFSSTEVNAAYEKIKNYYNEGLIYRNSDRVCLRSSGAYSADKEILPLLLSKAEISADEIVFLN